MKSKTILFRDPVVERVCDKFVKRSDVGYAKYGRTLHNERTGKHKDLAGYLNDVQEELMDAILYIQAAKEELADKPHCRCRVKDVNKTTLGDVAALAELKEKMDFKKAEKNQLEWARKNYPNDFYGSDYTSNVS